MKDSGLLVLNVACEACSDVLQVQCISGKISGVCGIAGADVNLHPIAYQELAAGCSL